MSPDRSEHEQSRELMAIQMGDLDPFSWLDDEQARQRRYSAA